MLWIDPSIARGRAALPRRDAGDRARPAADAQPGKILHETRHGEMAQSRRGAVPPLLRHGRRDAALRHAGRPVFRAHRRSRDDPRHLAATSRRRCDWIDEYGDPTATASSNIAGRPSSGLANQGWKDSHDAIFHADGATRRGPDRAVRGAGLRLRRQAHAASARRAASAIPTSPPRCATRPRGCASASRRRSGARRSAPTRWRSTAPSGPAACATSNAGHALFTGIAVPERARRVAATLMSPDSFSGWGIRTVARGEAALQSDVLPQRLGLAARQRADRAGLRPLRLQARSGAHVRGLFDAATYQELRRLPELFCGFIRRPHRGPTAYPVACSPQAWAAAAPFALLGACLGAAYSAREGTRSVSRSGDAGVPRRGRHPRPAARGSRVDLRLHRHGSDTTLNVLRREGDIRVTLSK